MNRNSQGRPFNNYSGFLNPQHQQAQYINSPPPSLEGTGRFTQTNSYNGRSVVQSQAQAGNINSAPVPGAPAARFEGQIPFHNPPGNQWIASHMIPQQMVQQGGPHVQPRPYMYQQAGQHQPNTFYVPHQYAAAHQMSMPRPPNQAPTQTTTFSSGIQGYQQVPLQTHAHLQSHVPQLQTPRPVQMTPMPNQQMMSASMSASQGTPAQYPHVQQMNHMISHQTHQNPNTTLQKRVPKPLTVIDPKTKRPIDLKETGTSGESENAPTVTADVVPSNDTETKSNVSVPVPVPPDAPTSDSQNQDTDNLQEGLNPAAEIFFPNQDISTQPTTRSTPEKEAERSTPENTTAMPESSVVVNAKSDDDKEDKLDEQITTTESVTSDLSKLRVATPEISENTEVPLPDVQADAADETVSDKAVDLEQQITESRQNPESTEPVACENSAENPTAEHEEVANENGTRDNSDKDGPSQDEDEMASGTSSPPPYDFRADSVEAPATTALRKLHYDRNYLINLQRCKAALRQPIGLPEELIEQGVILKKANPLDLTKPLPALKSKGMDDFTPEYARLSQYSSRGGRFPRDGQRQQGGGGPGSRYGNAPNSQRRGSQQSSRKIEVAHRQPVKIHTSENAYVPAIVQRNRGRAPVAVAPQDDEGEDTREKNRRQRICFSLLNKLTPQNSDIIFDQIRESGILCDGGGIDDIASAIFKKAISEPPYSVALADLVSKIMGEYESDEMQKHKTFFKQTLLSRCQNMFETELEKQVSEEEDKMKKKMEEEKDTKIKHMLGEEIEEVKVKVRLKYYGNIKFVGELYLRGLVGAKTIHDCVATLLQHKTEESIESVCKFLETTGSRLDQGQAMRRVDHYFARIEKIKEKIDSKRLKFKLEDLIDMRTRKWTLRERAAEYQVRPRTRAELEKERIEEENKKQAAVEKMVARKREEGRYGNRGGYSGRSSGGPIGSLMGSGRRSMQNEQANQAMVNSDGWKTITSRRVDPRSLAIKNESNETDVKLGPGTSMVSKWSQGCRTKGKDSGDRVSATKNFGRQGLSPSPRNSANSSRRGSNSNIPAAVSSGSAAAVTAGGRDSAAPDRVESEQSRNGTPGTDPGAPSTFTIERPTLDSKMRNTIENKAQHIFSEYSAHKEFDVHAFESIKLYGDAFVESLVQHVIEKSKVGRIDAGNMMAMMIQKGYIRAEDMTEGLKPHFEAAADILMDVPKFFSYIAEILSGCICDEVMQALPSIMRNLEQQDEVGNIVCEMLHLASEQIGHDKVGTMFRTAGLDWHIFLSSAVKMDSFIQSNKLEFTLTGGVPKVPDSSTSLEDLEVQLQELISKSKLNVEDVFSLLESSIDKRTSTSPEFISMVVRTIANVSIGSSDFELLQQCSPVLKYIIDKDTDRMLTALFAIQQITPTTKESRINAVFEVLSDSKVISDDAFQQYYEMDDPEISEGYSQTIHATANFYATLMNT